jgi:transposase
MTSTKYIGMDVHKESISIQVMNSVGKVVMECVIETKASTILQFIDGLRGDVRVTFEEGTWAAWLYDLLKPHVTEVVVCNPRKAALLKDGSKGDRIDAHKLAELLYLNKIKSVYHGEHGLRTTKKYMHDDIARNGSAGSAKPASGDVPNTATSSWMPYVCCTSRYAGICCWKARSTRHGDCLA